MWWLYNSSRTKQQQLFRISLDSMILFLFTWKQGILVLGKDKKCSCFTILLSQKGILKMTLFFFGLAAALAVQPSLHLLLKLVSSIIFVDLPVGAGYSYATSEAAFQSSDSIVASQAVQFMRKWLTEHHEFQSNPLYICGDSYAGVHLPIVVQLITLDNEMGSKPRMNIKGYILGNPSTDDQFDVISRIPTAHGLALISDELYQSLETNCGSILHPTNNTSCIKSLASFQECLAGLYLENILYPMCGLASPNPTEIVSDGNRRRFMWDRQQSSSLAITIPTFGCVTYPHLLSNYWADDKAVRKALHVRKDTVEKWSRCNYRPDYTKDVTSSFMYHVSLSTKGYRSLIYSGDHDLIVPSMGTQAWIQALNYSIVEDWRSWHVDGQVAGYTTSYSNGMTFATIKGAGHIAPEYKPNECSLMFKRWIDHEPL
ncbi:Serine carboxypeptidase-like 18 [Linum grandiflorum]